MAGLATPEDVTRRYEAAWNAHDMVLFATLFHPEASFVNRFATRWKGAEAIVAGHAAIHETVYGDSKLKIDPPDVTLVGDGIAVCHFWNRLEVGNAHPSGPHEVDTLVLAVLTRRDGDWRILAAENVTLTDPRSGKAILRSR